MTRMSVRSISIVFFCQCASLTSAQADLITDSWGTTDPNGAWSYSAKYGIGQGNSASYIPTISDWAGASLIGYVTYPTPPYPIESFPGWVASGPGFSDTDSVRVFTTYLLADSDMSIPVAFTGDDGSSIYLDGNLVGARNGSIGYIHPTINLTGGVLHKLELGVYNGPGYQGVVFVRNDNQSSIDTLSGLSLFAQASAVPEPGSMALCSIAVGFAGWRQWLKRRDKKVTV